MVMIEKKKKSFVMLKYVCNLEIGSLVMFGVLEVMREQS